MEQIKIIHANIRSGNNGGMTRADYLDEKYNTETVSCTSCAICNHCCARYSVSSITIHISK